MGRKPKSKIVSAEVDQPVIATPPEIQQQGDAFVRRDVDEPQTKAERISLKLKDDGLIDWESHRGDTKERIVKAFANDAEALRLIGLQSPLLPAGQGVTEENATAALNALAALDAMLIPFAVKIFTKMQIERPVAVKAFTFSDKELKEMAPRAARLANKYSSAAMLKYQDEIALLGMFGLYLSQQVQLAVLMQVQLNAHKAAQQKTVQTMPENASQPVNGQEATG